MGRSGNPLKWPESSRYPNLVSFSRQLKWNLLILDGLACELDLQIRLDRC